MIKVPPPGHVTLSIKIKQHQFENDTEISCRKLTKVNQFVAVSNGLMFIPTNLSWSR